MPRRPAFAAIAAASFAVVPFLPGCHNAATAGDPPHEPVAPAGSVEMEEQTSVGQAEELLIGRFPGVRVIQMPGGGIAVRVWGTGPYGGDRDPLYVVDGVPVQTTPGRGLEWLNPGDIQTIEVLKDASETAVYGVRGGNGVVLITTRRGSGGDLEG